MYSHSFAIPGQLQLTYGLICNMLIYTKWNLITKLYVMPCTQKAATNSGLKWVKNLTHWQNEIEVVVRSNHWWPKATYDGASNFWDYPPLIMDKYISNFEFPFITHYLSSCEEQLRATNHEHLKFCEYPLYITTSQNMPQASNPLFFPIEWIVVRGNQQ